MLSNTAYQASGVRPSSYRNSLGFTVVELLVTVGLIAISTALAVPSYQDMLEKRRLTQGAEQIAAFFNSAQAEAIRRNEPVTISYDKEERDEWCLGAIVGTTDCDCMETVSTETDYCKIDSVPRIFSDADLFSFDFMDGQHGDGAFAYEPVRGMMMDTDDDFHIHVRSASGKYKVRVEVTAAGQVRVCSQDESHELPGFGLCG